MEPNTHKVLSVIKLRFTVFISLCLLFVVVFTQNVTAQTIVTVGSGGSYTTLKGAFDAINAGSVNGDVVIQITGNTTETASAILNATGSGEAIYNSVTIYPTVGGLSISGNLSTPIINFVDADNVTLDGRVNKTGSTNSLTISNTNIGGSVIQFINDASANTIRYCTIQGVTSSAASGLVVFGGGTITGNDNNVLEYCDIKDGATTPTNAIYSAGSSTTADNSNINIINNNIYNYFNSAISSNGIFVASNSSAWNISDNKFFQTTIRTTTVNSTIHRAIQIIAASGLDFTINNNIIGFANANSTGITTYDGAFTNLYRAIEMNVGASSSSNIQGNTISGISFSTTNGLATAPGVFSGIYILAGQVNVGSITGNTIGSTTGLGSIQITSTTSLGMISGIYYTTTSSGVIKNNKIGSFRTGGATNIGYTFNGIYTVGTGGNYTISDNVVGSTTTANSIAIGLDGTTTTPTCTFRGIYNLASGIISISNNTVQNCSVYGTGASVFSGILNSAGTGTLDITGNKVISGTNTGTGIFVPITNAAAVANLNLNNNIIRSHYKTAIAGTFTALSNTGAVLSTININNNQLGNVNGGLITYNDANSATLLGVSNSGGAASCDLSIQNNDIRGIEQIVAGTNAHTYFINSAAALSQNISNNTLTALNVNTTGTIILISNNVAMPSNGVQNINNNAIITSFTRVTSSGALTLFTSTTSTNNNNVIVNNNNNNFSNININGTATILGLINTDAGSGTYTKTIDGNTFNNWTAGTGAITALTVNINNTSNAVKNNVISNINSAGTITGITTAAGNDNIFSNTITNFNSTGGVAATIVSGINVTAGTVKNIYNNTISNLAGNSFTTGSVRGILISGGTEVNFYENKVFSITANANTSGTVSGVWVISVGTTVNVYRNKVYDISSTSIGITTGHVQGIQISGSTANLIVNVRNNLIADIKAPAISLVNAVRGINIISTGTNSINNIYYNSIYLNASSTGANFGSAGIYHTASSNYNSATLDLRNNIIVNVSTPSGTGQTVAFFRSSGTAGRLSNYASTSNNNLFYASTPSANQLIYADGTATAQTIDAYKAGVFTAGTIAPRDQASVSENPTFLSTVGSNSNFLHLNPSVATRAESGAVNISPYTVDYNGTIRQGNPGYLGISATAPDMGAIEGNYPLIDVVAPSITYSLLTNNSCLDNQYLTVSINDATGVNVISGTKPRVYFKRSTDTNVYNSNTSATAGWKWVEASETSSPFNFTFNYALLSGGTGVTTGQTIQYFVVAQDVVSTPNVGINAGTFAAAPPNVNLTSAAFPIGGTINSYTILAGLSGTVAVGAGQTYTSLTGSAGLFSAINTYGLKGNLVATIMDASIAETAANSLNSIVYGCNSNYTLTIKPNVGLAATLTGAVDGGPVINFNGADNVIFDGLNTGGSTLTIRNTSTSATANTSTIRFIGDASNNSIVNCYIEGSGTGATTGTIIFTTGISTGNDGNVISYNNIRPAGSNLPTNAIYSAGSTVSIDNNENTVNNNNIQDYFNAGIASNGIFLTSNNSAWTIKGNKFYQTATRIPTAALVHRAIQVVSTLGGDYTISNNTIGFANSSSTGLTTYAAEIGFTFRAIEINVGTTSASSIQGNTIAGISLSTTSGSTALPGVFSGISVLGGNLNVGTTTGNTVGATTGNGSIAITSTTSLGVITGIYSSSSGIVNIQNNKIGAINLAGTELIGFTFHGIYTAGGGQYNVSNNILGSTTTANSINIGSSTTSTPICTLNGIVNVATGGTSINNNTIQNVTVYGTGASLFNGILNSGVADVINIVGNNIIAINNTGTTTGTTTKTGWIKGISNTAAATNININDNIIRNLTKPVANGEVFGISNNGGVLTTLNINNNQLGNVAGGFISYTNFGNIAFLYGISNTAGAANCALSIQNNNIQGVNYAVAGSNANTYIINTAATLSQNISGNTFTNLSVNTTGTLIFISNSVIMPTDGVQNINDNRIVTAFTRTATSGATTLFTSTAATNNNNVVVNNNNNNFSNITLNGTATMSGWINTDAGLGNAIKTIDGNTFSNWVGSTGTIIAMNINITSPNNLIKNNNINTISSNRNIYGIITGAGSGNIFSNTIHTLISSATTSTVVNGIAITTTGTEKNVYLNTIYNLQANSITTGSVSGIAVTGGFTNNIYRNKIHNVSCNTSSISTGSVNGILISGSVSDLSNTIYNNIIGDIKAPLANVLTPVYGINIANTGLRATSNVYFNSIYLNASSTGTNFGSSGIYHIASTLSTTSKLNLRNNVIVNNSTPNGTGLTVAFRRSVGTSGALNNYASTSNNNLFYAGVPGSSNLIYYDGTSSAQAIDDYKIGSFTAGTISPRDQLSVSENPIFSSIIGADENFLDISPSDVSFIESGAVNITGISTDYHGYIRSGNPGYPTQSNGFGSAPDMGAHEFDGVRPRVLVTNSNVLSDGRYANLGTALNAINGQDQSGKNIEVKVIGNTTETATCILNEGSWTTLKIYPTVASITIGGNLNASLIHLDGADNVTIDGRVNQTGSAVSMKIENTSTAAVAGTSTIQLSNSAEANSIKYCNVVGSTTSIDNGVITFSGSASGNGNDNNLIDRCNLTNSGGNRPVNVIYSQSSAGIVNNSIVVSNNNIYNFFNNAISSNGINLNANTSDWTISANSFYETTSFVPTAGTTAYNVIQINNTLGSNFSITGNYIGGQASLCGGGAWNTDAATNHSFSAINIKVGTITASSIQNNIIRNWNYQSGSATPWKGIEINEGKVNIGTVTANYIGSTTGTGSISLTSTENAYSYGIYINSTSVVTVSKNNIGSINISGNNTVVAHSFAAIYNAVASGTLTISNNVIGSTTTSNSIRAISLASTSSVPQHLKGIFSESTGTVDIVNNTIANFSNSYAGALGSETKGIHTTNGSTNISKTNIYNLSTATAGAGNAVVGIDLNGANAVSNSLVDCLVYNLSATNSVYTGFVIGVSFAGSTTNNVSPNDVRRNFIRNLSVNSSTNLATICGIYVSSGDTYYANNIISLGGNTASTIYGFYGNSINNNDTYLNFNTVYIDGNLPAGTTNKSYCLYSGGNSNNRDFRNNIFANFRSTEGASSLHYGIFMNYATTEFLNLDYNDYWTPGVGGVPCYYAGSNRLTVPFISGVDIHDLISDPLFVYPQSTLATGLKVGTQLDGDASTSIKVDYTQNARNVPPSMGAWEYNSNLWLGTVSSDFDNPSNWSTNQVPIEEASVVFGITGTVLNDCVLDQDRLIGNIVNSSDKNFVINSKNLSMLGDIVIQGTGKVDATLSLSKILFIGEFDAQQIPNQAFVNDVLPCLTIDNGYGVVLNGNLTISDTLRLQSNNPSDIKGVLDVSSTYSLILGPNLIFLGDGDISGIVKRTSLEVDKAYPFVNRKSTILFQTLGDVTTVSCKLNIGIAPTWKTTAVKRIYDIIHTNASPTNPTLVTVTSSYLDSELNGNDEEKLVNYSYRYVNGMLIENGHASNDVNENWVKLTNVNMAFFSSTIGAVELGIADNELETLTWNGSGSTSWTTPTNWTPIGAPSHFVNIIIPDAVTTTFDPILPPETTIKTLRLKSGSILNATTDALATITGKEYVWVNEGGVFNPSTSTIAFTNDNDSITGTTDFYNIKISAATSLHMLEGSVMRIGGSVTNLGTWRTAAYGVTTVEYNGDNQTIAVPSSATNRYSNLILSGNGVKTMPSTTLSIWGDLTLSGFSTMTATNNLVVNGSFILNSNATFTTGSFNHTIGGDFVKNGTFNSAGSTFTFTGFTAPQTISGSSLIEPVFNNFVNLNEFGVVSNVNISVNGVLSLETSNPTDSKGALDMGANTLLMAESATTTGQGDVTGIVKRTSFNANIPYSFGNTFTTILFSESGTRPSMVSVKLKLGSAPTWKTSAIKRVYDFVQNGGENCATDVSVNYLKSELNSNSETKLVFWGANGFPSPTFTEWGRTEIDADNEWLLLHQMSIDLWPTAFGQTEITLAETANPNLTWNGSISSSFLDSRNWTPKTFPNEFCNIIIPNATTTTFDPILPTVKEINKLIIQSGGILDGSSSSIFAIRGYQGNAWSNEGNYIAGNSVVIFNDPEVTISGTTNFNNLTLSDGATLTPLSGTITRIAGAITNQGIFDVTTNNNTLEYNGADQEIIQPNGTLVGYHNLILSGSGIKTLPSDILNINGDLSLSGIVTTTLLNTTNIVGSLTIGSSATLNPGGQYITLKGNLTHDGTFNNLASTIELLGASTQSISGTAGSTFFSTLLVHQPYGVICNKDITVNTLLDLQYNNPSSTAGLLQMNNYTLNMGINANQSGLADVTGIVRREHPFENDVEYFFGNRNTTINFLNFPASTKPTWISCKITIGSSPSWKSEAIKRYYSFAQSGGNDRTILKLHYLDSELDGTETDESKLVYWDAYDPAFGVNNFVKFYPRNKNNNNTTDNWIQLTGPAINYIATSTQLNVKQWGLAYSNVNFHTWTGNGSPTYDGDWSLPGNWNGGVPNANDVVLIPNPSDLPSDNNGDLYPYVNLLSIISPASAKSVEIASGASLDASNYSITIYGDNNAWVNNGTFIPGNSEVVFANGNPSTAATISGVTNFNDIRVGVDTKIQPTAGSIIGIKGSFNYVVGSILDFTSYNNTIEYNGVNQPVIIPNGTIPGYYNLTLSGSAIKTMPTSLLDVLGNFTVSGTTTATPQNSLNIGGSLIVNSSSTFNLGEFIHNVGGDIINNGGVFNAAGSTINLNGAANQLIGGSSSTTFNNLSMNNANGATLGNMETIAGVLTLTNGLITTGVNTLTTLGTIAGASATSYINGKLARVFSSVGSKDFPIGKGGNYRPITLNYSSLTGTSAVTVEQFETSLPGTLPAKTTLFTSRYWELSQSGGSAYAFYITLNGTGWNRRGAGRMLKGDGITNSAFEVNGSNYTNISSFDSFGNFGLGETDIVWSGATNNNWNVASNWSSQLVPSGDFDIVIPSALSTYPVISGASPVNDVTIAAGTKLDIMNGATLTLEETPLLTFASGANVTTGTGSKIIIKSDARYLNLSSSTPMLEMQRNLTGVGGWRMVASPLVSKVNDMFKAPLVTQGFTGSTYPALQPNLMWWDETDKGTSLQAWRQPANLVADLASGRGYFHFVFNGAGVIGGGTYSDLLPTTMSVNGVENFNGSGSYNYNLTYTPRATSQVSSVADTTYYDVNALDQGWNLVGNPTASTLNWDAVGAWTKTNVDNTIYVWDPSALSGNGDYLAWNGFTGTLPNGKIPPFQSFWVHASAATPILSFTNAAKSTTIGTFMRTPALVENVNVPLTLSNNSMETTSFVTFTNSGKVGVDSKDAYRLESMSDTKIELYTLSSPHNVSPLVINNLPLNDTVLVNIPLFVNGQIKGKGINDNYTLHWELPANWPSKWNVSLLDHQKSIVISMNESSHYNFNYTSKDSDGSSTGGIYSPNQLVKNSTKTNMPVGSTAPFSIIINKNGNEIAYMKPQAHFLTIYPNPFSNFALLLFSLPEPAKVRIDVIDLNGAIIATPVNGNQPAGINEYRWTPKNQAAGMYFVRLISGNTVEIQKIILMNQ